MEKKRFFNWKNLLDLGLDPNDQSNARHTFIHMFFDRWQHCRQMSQTITNIYNLETANQSVLDEYSTLISNTKYLTDLLEQMSIDSPVFDQIVPLIGKVEQSFSLFKVNIPKNNRIA